MWYVLQTMTGQEEELVQLVKERVPSNLYEECFVAYYERIWRKQQKSIIHVERLFPGYVFIISDKPERLYLSLKDIPVMAKLLSDGNFGFLPIRREEEAFFQDILSKERIVRLSYVETDEDGSICQITGPIEKYAGQVERYQFKKRYAIVSFPMMGEKRTAALGILLKEDIKDA